MSVEATLVSLIETGTTYRCYPLEKPQKVTKPVVVYQRLTTTPQKVLNAKSSFNRVRMGLTIWGEKYVDVQSATETIISLLDEEKTYFSLVYLLDQRDFKEPESGLYYSYIEFFIFSHN